MADLFLLGHGSREAAATDEFHELLGHVADRWPGRVGGGFIELAEPPADEALDKLVADGADEIAVVPYVLFGAGHLKDDGPALLARARTRHPDVHFHLARDIGLHASVLDVAEHRAAHDGSPDHAVVVVGRGSTDPDACADLVKMTRLLGDGRGIRLAEPAFIAMSQPDVEGALERARRLGAERITVLPLFLFTGVLVGRLGEQVAAWAEQHPDVAVATVGHLGVDERMADAVIDRGREALGGDARMNCDLCAYRVRLPGYEEKLGTPLTIQPEATGRRGWRARRAANQAVEDAAARRERPHVGLGRRSGVPDAPSRDGAVVAVRGLVHTFPDGTAALNGIDLEVQAGERVAIVGANGSGKTTLALHLVGALERTAGEVSVTGLPVSGATLATVRRRVGFVFQDPDDQLLLPTVAADVAYGLVDRGVPAEEIDARVERALDVTGLTDVADRAPQQLSLGERRRVAIAGVLAGHPEVLMLDEPTANLDPAGRRDLIELVGGLALTTLVITHDLALAAELCPRSVVLAHGRVAADGPTAALLANTALLTAHRLT